MASGRTPREPECNRKCYSTPENTRPKLNWMASSSRALSALQLVPLLQKDKADLTLEVSNEEKQIDLEKQSNASNLKVAEAKLDSCQADLKSAKYSKLKDVMKVAGVALA